MPSKANSVTIRFVNHLFNHENTRSPKESFFSGFFVSENAKFYIKTFYCILSMGSNLLILRDLMI